MIHPLREAMERNDTILVIAHSLGTMIAYDTFWKASRTGEYRPEYTEKGIDLFITIGSPLGDNTVKPTFPIWLNIPLSKSSAFFKPLSICETLAVGMAIITP